MDRRVAIKELSLHQVDEPEIVERCQEEADLLCAIDHVGVPRYHDVFIAGPRRSQSLYLVQEFVVGRSLADELETRRYSETEVLDIVYELLRILAYLHAMSPPVVHQCIKPGNVMRREDGGLILVDFGTTRDAIVRVLEANHSAQTCGYLAPEQRLEESSGVASRSEATDIYGLGALAVALLTGRDPAEMIDDSHGSGWEEHVSVAESTRRILTAMLQPSRFDRSTDIEELRAWIRGTDVPRRLAPPPRRLPLALWVIKTLGADVSGLIPPGSFSVLFCSVGVGFLASLRSSASESEVGMLSLVCAVVWSIPLLMLYWRAFKTSRGLRFFGTVVVAQDVRQAAAEDCAELVGKWSVTHSNSPVGHARGWTVTRTRYTGPSIISYLQFPGADGRPVYVVVRSHKPYVDGVILYEPSVGHGTCISSLYGGVFNEFPKLEPDDAGQWTVRVEARHIRRIVTGLLTYVVPTVVWVLLWNASIAFVSL